MDEKFMLGFFACILRQDVLNKKDRITAEVKKCSGNVLLLWLCFSTFLLQKRWLLRNPLSITHLMS